MTLLKAKLKIRHFEGGHRMFYRPGSTDERIITEVIDHKCYRRATIGFDAEPGEHWLDAGANIGAFAVYCLMRGATVDCYEPEPECFRILNRNALGQTLIQSAITHLRGSGVPLWASPLDGNYARYTVMGQIGAKKCTPVMVPNTYAGDITTVYDGVKMDIEGSELGIIDVGLLPRCRKLCLEYHSSRDLSVDNLRKRLETLKRLFGVVSYPAELDRIVQDGKDKKTYFDRFIWCMQPKQGA